MGKAALRLDELFSIARDATVLGRGLVVQFADKVAALGDRDAAIK